MANVTYEIVEHDGGWAYRLGGVFSEPFPTRDDAVRAARIAADEQRLPGEGGPIDWQDPAGRWHHEQSEGGDRPSTKVEE